MTHPDGADVVHLTIVKLDPSHPRCLNQNVVSTVETSSAGLVDAAAAAAREFVVTDHLDLLLGAIERTFSNVPASGCAAVINRPSGLMLVALWPRATGTADAPPPGTPL